MQNIVYISAITGMTITCQVYDSAGAVGASISTTEIGTTGQYIGTIPSGIPLGNYIISAFIGSTRIASGELFWDGEEEMTPEMYYQMNAYMGFKKSEPTEMTKNSDVDVDVDMASGIHLDITEVGNVRTIQRTT